ncbi:MAG: PaaI family thioesterase [Pseudomonadota bacterium]|nr:PaaI family thioesterase [Pseudomonadota bacterium]
MSHLPSAFADYESRVRSSFEQQGIMKAIGATLTSVTPGEVRIDLPFGQAVTQQHGYFHGGIVTTIVDSACGYAAYSLMPAHSEVLTVEYKVNFLAPAKGEKIVGIGKVIRAGRSITVCSGEARAFQDGKGRLVAIMQATMMMIKTAS